MYKYSDKSERYQDAFLFYSNNIINELILEKDKNNKGSCYLKDMKSFNIYDNESIQIEIENEFIDYFGFILDILIIAEENLLQNLILTKLLNDI